MIIVVVSATSAGCDGCPIGGMEIVVGVGRRLGGKTIWQGGGHRAGTCEYTSGAK